MSGAKIISYIDSVTKSHQVASLEDIKSVLAIVEEENNKLHKRVDQLENKLERLEGKGGVDK